MTGTVLTLRLNFWQRVSYRLISQISNHLPERHIFSLSRTVASIVHRFERKRRRVLEKNLISLLGQDPVTAKYTSREVFKNFACYLVECLTVRQATPFTFDSQGMQLVEQVYSEGRGCILLTAHIGNWEMGAIALRRLGFPTSAVSMTFEDPVLSELFHSHRSKFGIDVIPLGPYAAQSCIRALRCNRLLCVLADRVYSGPSKYFKCAEGYLNLALGPAIIAKRTLAPIIPAFFLRRDRKVFRFYFGKPIRVHDPNAAMAEYAEVLAQTLKQFPEQWMFFDSVLTKETPA